MSMIGTTTIEPLKGAVDPCCEKKGLCGSESKEDAPKMESLSLPLKSMVPSKTIMLTNNLRFLEDAYNLGDPIGEPGNFGVAYLCSPKSNENETFVVKRISKARLYHIRSKERQDMLNQITNEIHLQKELNHPNICKLHDVYEGRNYVDLIMERLTGGELFDRIQNEDGFSERSAAKIAFQMLDAISFMHSKNICHFDLKPDNILFANKSPDSPIKIIDFGMSQALPRLKKLKQLAGTAYYMAPEVIAGNYDRAADVWSIGIIIFCMLFGFPPHYVDSNLLKMGESEEDEIKKMIRLKGFDAKVKSGYGPWFPESIPVTENARDLLSKMLAYDVKDRLTAEEAFNHPWIRGQNDVKQLPRTIFSSLVKFQKTTRFKVLISRLFAQKLDPQRYSETVGVFKQWDKNGDGALTMEEFRQGMKATTKFEEKEIDKIFESLDQNHDKKITFEELIISSAFDALISTDERMYRLFSDLDKDGDGKLTIQELKDAIGELGNAQDLGHVESILAEIDNGDHQTIDYQQFLRELHPTLNEVGPTDMNRLRSRGFEMDPNKVNKYVREAKKAQLLDGVINPHRFIEAVKSVAPQSTPRRASNIRASIGSLANIDEGSSMPFVNSRVPSKSQRDLKAVAEFGDSYSSDEDDNEDESQTKDDSKDEESDNENENENSENENDVNQTFLKSQTHNKQKIVRITSKNENENKNKNKRETKNENENENENGNGNKIIEHENKFHQLKNKTHVNNISNPRMDTKNENKRKEKSLNNIDNDNKASNGKKKNSGGCCGCCIIM